MSIALPGAREQGMGGRQATAAPFAIARRTLRRSSLLIGTVLVASQALSEEIIFTADADVMVVRGRQALDFAIYEVLGTEDGEIRCIAIDKAGEPMAVTIGYVEHSAIMFQDLKVADVDRVVCKYQ